MAPDMRAALNDRKTLIEQRARTLAHDALRDREPWVKQLGDPLVTERARWTRAIITVAAYRDRYGITSRDPLGGQPATDVQRLDRARAQSALRHVTVYVSAEHGTVATGREGIGR